MCVKPPEQPQVAPAQIQEMWFAAWLRSGAYLSPPLLVGMEGAQQAAGDALHLKEPPWVKQET